MHNAFMLPVAALGLLEEALNSVIALDPRTGERIAALDGKVIALVLTGPGLTLYLRCTDRGLMVMGAYDGEVDTTLRGSPLSLLNMSLGEPSDALLKGMVEIEGDTELGQRFRTILEGLDVDWEEHLSRLTGDIVAHQMGNFFRGLERLGRDTVDALGRDLADYLKFEQDLLPERHEVGDFVEDVDKVRSDVDRLEARVKRLARKAASKDQ